MLNLCLSSFCLSGMLGFVLCLGSLLEHACAAEEKPEASPAKSKLLFKGARVPSLVRTKKGSLLAICSVGDNARGSCLIRRSTNNGETWSKTRRFSPDGHKLRTQFSSISVVADQNTGTVWCFYNKGTDRWNAKKPPILFSYSEDDGVTWKEAVKPYGNDRFSKDLPPLRSVQGRGIQLDNGRLLAPCYRLDKHRGPAYLYSDDAGKTWKVTGSVKGKHMVGVEFCTLQLAGGSLYMNGRKSDGSMSRITRWVSRSKDGGLTWSNAKWEKQLSGAPCHAGLIRLTGGKKDDKSRILFSLPATGSQQKRTDLKVWISYDECKTWKKEHARILQKGSVAYSDMTLLPDKSVGCLYESSNPWHSIYYTSFTLEWLTGGKDKIEAK